MAHIGRLLGMVLVITLGCGPGLPWMQVRAERGEVQEDAPLHARQSVTIHAPRGRVWALITGFADWPHWQPTISRVTAPASLTAGEPFLWVNGSSEIHSTLALVEPESRIAWTGRVSTAKAIHVWRLSEPAPGATSVEVEETLDGFLLTWFYHQRDLDAEVARSLDALRRAAESPE